MVQFGKKLLKARYAPWEEQYLDYKQLKKKISAIVKTSPPGSPSLTTICDGNGVGNTHEQHQITRASHDWHLQHQESKFQEHLHNEIEKVVLFYLKTQGTLASQLKDLRDQQRQLTSEIVTDVSTLFLDSSNKSDAKPTTTALSSPRKKKNHLNLSSPYRLNTSLTTENLQSLMVTLQTLTASYRSQGEILSKLVRYAELNATAVRKILKKHDKKIKSITSKTMVLPILSPRYWQLTHTSEVDCLLRQLYRYDGIAALVTTLRSGLFGCQILQMAIQCHIGGDTADPEIHSLLSVVTSDGDDASYDVYTKARLPAVTVINALLSLHPLFTLSPPDHSTSEGAVSGHNHHLLLERATSWVNDREPTLAAVTTARSNLRTSTTFIRAMAANAHFLLMSDEDDLASISSGEDGLLARRRASDRVTPAPPVSSTLNLLSALLYMTNYYVVAPTSASYATHLGADPSFSGIIIGATPVAACVSAVLYSYWANHSYKSALLFASACSAVGNIFYALGGPQHRLSFVMLGRLLNGFGGARAINRRYIADNFRREEKTAASAAFVTASALGMSIGPGLAAVLGYYCPPSIAPADGSSRSGALWTVETAPGWVMFAVWSVYLIAAALYFEEPKRKTPPIISPSKQMIELKAKTSDSAIDEETPLIPSSDQSYVNSTSDLSTSTPTKSKKSLIPIYVTLANYFFLKFALECLLSSSEPVTEYYFEWGSSTVGTYLAVLGLLLFPANLLVANVSQKGYDDRQLVVFFLLLTTAGCIGMLDYSSIIISYTSQQYIVFGVAVFIATNALESVSMALLSKKVPKSWAVGTFNSGLLATEAGTAGRAFGDIFISLAGGRWGFSELINSLFGVSATASVGMLAIVLKWYDLLDDDDDDDD